MAVEGTWILHGRGEQCSPAKRTLKEKYHKETFLLSYFSMTKSTKSHQRERSPLFENSSSVHELVARAVRGECVRQQAKQKVGGFITLRNLSYTTRANMSHEKAKQIRARIVCTPAESARRAWGSLCADGMESAFLFCLLVILGFYLVGVGAVDDPQDT